MLDQIFAKLQGIFHRPKFYGSKQFPGDLNLYDPNFRFPSFFTDPYEEKAFDGLNLLLELGEPFHFTFEEHSYRIDKAGSSQYVSLWEDGAEQPFPDLTALMEGAVLNGRSFEECFPDLPLGVFL